MSLTKISIKQNGQSVVFMRAGSRVSVLCGDRRAQCASYAEAMAAAYAMAFEQLTPA